MIRIITVMLVSNYDDMMSYDHAFALKIMILRVYI